MNLFLENNKYYTELSVKKYLFIFEGGYYFSDDFKDASNYFKQYFNNFVDNPKDKKLYTHYMFSKISTGKISNYVKEKTKKNVEKVKIYKLSHIEKKDNINYVVYV